MAVPCREMFCGELDVLLATEIWPRCTLLTQVDGSFGAVCPQSVVGENLTVAEQLEPAVIDPPQVSETENSLLPEVMATLVAVANPVFEMVKTAGPLVVPTVVLPKLMVETARTSVGVPTKPVQESVTTCGLVAVLSVTVKVAGREPAAVGLQFNVIEQLLPGVTVPQPFVIV